MPIHWDLLSDTQKRLIEHNKGPMLVFAGPGTGKTEVLTQRIAYLARQGIDPEQIRAITFTKKARNEMIDRLKEFEGLEDVNFNISTLHGLAVQILATYGKLRKYKAANDETAIIFMDAVEDIAGRLERAEYKKCIEWVESQKNNNKRHHECDENQNKQIYERYEELLEYNNVQDLSGIIINCVSLLNILDDVYDSGIQHLLVDEYQDINHTDYALIKHLSKGTDSVFFVGDDDQSIYGWRGADPQILHDFETDYNDALIETIEESRRCTEEILNGAIEIVNKCKIYHLKKLISVQGKGEKINLVTSNDHEIEAEWVSNKIIDLNKNQGLELKDISILTKQLNRTDEIYKNMQKKGIAVNYWRPNQIFRDSNIRKIFAVIRILCDRNDNLALRLCLKHIKNYGIGTKGIKIIRKIAEERKTSPWDIIRNQNRLKECGKWGPKYEKFADMIDNLEIKITDKTPEECIQLISKIFLTKNTPKVEQLIEFSRPLYELTLVNFIQEFNNQRGLELTDENAPTTPEENAVNIMSLHASKGLGFKAVFVVGLEETFFPNPSQDNDEQR